MNRVLGWGLGIILLIGLGGHAALAQSADPTAAADAYVNAPHDWQMWLPVAGSPMEARIDWLMKYVLWIMTAIVVFVGVLMVYVMINFRSGKNKTPAHFTHNTLIEVIWIVVPTLLLAVIIVPSISLIYYEADDSSPFMTINVTGHQWYWEYSYPSVPGLDYTSYMVPDDKLQPGDIRRLSVDHPIVVPVGKKIKFDITSADVLHGFYLPSLGVQRYAIPGTVVHSWTIIPKVGTYYGQCNQICGVNHDAMPIEIKAVSMDDYLAWIKVAQANYVMNSYTHPLSSPLPVNEFADLAVTK